MSDGGVWPWKVQRLIRRGPAADYSGLSKPLPPPPEGQTWQRDDQTQEWKLVAATGEEEPELLAEKTKVVEVGLPPTSSNNAADHSEGSHNNDDEWEFLSDRQSCSHHSSSGTTTGGNGVLVPKTVGSVRSITTLECYENASLGSVPFKIQRTASSSTIDSNDDHTNLGPTGKGVLGVDYVEHVILPTDTLQGICIAYKISSMRLRQANHFSGSTLLLAPKKLVIPISKKALRSGYIRVQDTDAKEYKLYSFLAEFPDLGATEAKAYLELADWVLKDAIESAREDFEWEQEMGSGSKNLKAGEIHLTVDKKRGFLARGAGIWRSSIQKKASSEETKPKSPPAVAEEAKDDSSSKEGNSKPAVQEAIPAIATKTVQAQDVYRASTQHENFGLELKPISSFSKKQEE